MGRFQGVPKPGVDNTSILIRLHELTEELIEGHQQLALLLTSEKEGQAMSWATYAADQFGGKDSVQARDRQAQYSVINVTTDIITLRGQMATWQAEYNFLVLLLDHRVGEQ